MERPSRILPLSGSYEVVPNLGELLECMVCTAVVAQELVCPRRGSRVVGPFQLDLECA